MGCSLSFNFCDYGTTIRRLLNDFQATLATINASDYRLSGDFPTISDFGDFRAGGCSSDRGAELGVSLEMSPSLYIWGDLTRSVRAPLGHALPIWLDGTECRFLPFCGVLALFDGVRVYEIGHFVHALLRLVQRFSGGA